MKSIVLINTDLNQCEHYEVDADTLTRIREMVNNHHDQTPIRVPPTTAEKKGDARKGGQTRVLLYDATCADCGAELHAGEIARFYRRRIYCLMGG